MGALGELIKQWWDQLASLWPFVIVSQWEEGIRLRNGLITSTEPVQPGLRLCWPAVGEILTEEVNLQTTETSLQTVTTADGHHLTFSLGVKWRIRDVKALYTTIHDAESTVLDEIRSAAGAAVRAATLEECQDPGFGETIASAARGAMRGWGVEIKAVRFITFTTAPPVRLLMDATE